LHFLKKKTTSYSKIFKILLRKISPPHRLTLLCSNVVKFFQWESVKSCIIYLTEKTSTAELTYIHPHMPILCPHGARISIVTFTSAHLYRTIIELEIELELAKLALELELAKMFCYFSFVSASAQVKEAVLLTAFDEA